MTFDEAQTLQAGDVIVQVMTHRKARVYANDGSAHALFVKGYNLPDRSQWDSESVEVGFQLTYDDLEWWC